MDPMIGINRYVYADNNPVVLVDNAGLANVMEFGGSASVKGGPKNPTKTPTQNKPNKGKLKPDHLKALAQK